MEGVVPLILPGCTIPLLLRPVKRTKLVSLVTRYTEIKDRADVQILSFNADREVGLAEPYLKENGRSFPVVAADVNPSLNRFAIPQNWIVDPAGEWRWTQLGFSEPNWTEAMLKRMESVLTPR